MLVQLDDPDSMSLIDASDMLGQITSFPSQLNASLVHRHRRNIEIGSVAVGGLGGSAMGGDVLAEYLALNSRVPAVVVRDTTLPRWADARTLVTLISYSGNTKETLSLYEEARERGCPLTVITSGGRIREMAETSGQDVVTVPPGLQPRAALGYLLGSAACVVESAGLAPMAQDVRALVPDLEVLLSDLAPSVPTSQNQAKQIARRLVNGLPFVYAPRPVRPAATRWQTQINENSKMLCLSGELPEMNHNQIVGWIDGERDARHRPVMLRPGHLNGTDERIMRTTIDLMIDHDLDPVVADLEGTTPLASTLHGIILGDMVSYYLAMLRGVDPLPVPAITELKRRMG